jgi:acetolactate synthase-1/2/3 large subunit
MVELEKAYYLSQEGPVLVDIPMNIQRTEIDINSLKSFFDSNEYLEFEISKKEEDNIQKTVNLLNISKRPIILIGGGVRLSDASEELLKYVEKYNIPVVYSLMGKDGISEDYKYNFGLIGSYGNRYGNLALANSDLIIVLGSRLDTRQTGTSLDTFAREAKIIQVDIDKNELGSKIKIDVEINSDVKDFMDQEKYMAWLMAELLA